MQAHGEIAVNRWQMWRWTFAIPVALGLNAPALANPLKPKLSADIRVRLEQDWDSTTATGAPRADRLRSRIRARLAARIEPAEHLSVALRVRTGGKGSQQNANVTFADFSGNPNEKLGVSLDQFEIDWKGKSAGIQIGRMTYPFFTQNEFMWDADINPLGLAAYASLSLGKQATLKATIGHFALPVGLAHYSGQLTAGQLAYSDRHVTLAGGIFHFQPSLTDPDRLRLLDGNGQRVYTVLVLNGRYTQKLAGKPLAMGVELFHNLEQYRDPSDNVGFANNDQRDGYVLSAAVGDSAAPRHFQFGYRYFHIERLAVNSSYSHDDISRLGVPSQAANSDLAGHDIFANYAVNRHLTAGIRFIFAHRLTNPEDNAVPAGSCLRVVSAIKTKLWPMPCPCRSAVPSFSTSTNSKPSPPWPSPI